MYGIYSLGRKADLRVAWSILMLGLGSETPSPFRQTAASHLLLNLSNVGFSVLELSRFKFISRLKIWLTECANSIASFEIEASRRKVKHVKATWMDPFGVGQYYWPYPLGT